ncbi:MAG: DNA polymerase I [Gammaproteobacteria bacterium]|nr:DNA polymerase I [Gammaproteobacteria bacterium]
MPNPTKPLVLVDGSSYLYRAFHALPALTNSKGFPTGAVYGMVNMLKRLILDYQPDYMAVVFDAKGKTFRDDLYKEYKATRQEMPSDLSRQIPPIHEIIKALGLPIIMIEGVEADDVIGTLAERAKATGFSTIISTGDKDLAQLVDEHVTLINTMSNTLYDPVTVKEKFGVPPELMIDYLTLVGDTSDNIPGVPLVGPKTAAKWLIQYGSLDNIVANAEKFTGKTGENLRNSIPNFEFVKSLVRIKLDVEVPLEFKQLAIQAADKTSLISHYKEMEFKTWLNDLLSETKEDNQKNYADYQLILTAEALDHFIEVLQCTAFFAFDVETNQFNNLHADLVGFAFATAPGQGVYIPVGHCYLGAPTQLSKAVVLAQLKPIFENQKIAKIGYNLKYAVEILTNHDIDIRGATHDTMVAAYVLDSTSSTYDIDNLALKYLGWRTTSFIDVAGSGVKQIAFDQVELSAAKTYAAEDADLTLRLHSMLMPRIEQELGLKRIYETIEMPLVPVLAQIEETGVLIDAEKLAEQGRELRTTLDSLETKAYALAGKPFNMNSPKQLQEILFQILKLPVLQKTPTRQPSTADGVLQELAQNYEMPRLIITYRSLSKLISTYINSLPQQIDAKTGRVHTSYHQTGTTTGRLSSSNPNLQNIPIRTVEGRRIRKAFIAAPGYKILSADYSQIELRLMAHISEDPNLLYAFNHDLDIHTATAAEVWDMKLEEVTPEIRRSAKAINFGLIYGMSAFGLTRQLNIDRQSAQDYIDRYFTRYPNVKAYMDNTRLQAKKQGYVETLWGRRLYIPDINASQMMRQKAAERAAINAPLQGSAADIIKLAMIHVNQTLSQDNLDAKIIMQVHDELVFEVAEQDVDRLKIMVQEKMAGVISLKVPLVVATGIGNNWDEASAH